MPTDLFTISALDEPYHLRFTHLAKVMDRLAAGSAEFGLIAFGHFFIFLRAFEVQF
jgi:hypothetical protein